MMEKTYRNNGAVGALLDEYEKALTELKELIENLSNEQLTTIVDQETEDIDCRSIQTILSHVVGSGYTYVIEVRKYMGEQLDYKKTEVLDNVLLYASALDKMFAFNVKLFLDYPEIQLEEYSANKKMTVRWGQKYDVEQLLEHAIVHVLRHRRQIERFKLKL